MGLTPKQIAARQKGRAGKSAKKKQVELSPQELLAQAQLHLDNGDPNEALGLMRRAAELAPSDVEVLDALGALLAEMGQGDAALAVLRRAAEIAPDSGHEKFMYLGQLLPDEEGLNFIKAGIRVLESRLASTSDPEEREQLSEDTCAALCALVEHMISGSVGDLAAVREEATEALARAERCCPSSPEPKQVQASLLYELGLPEEALGALRESMAKWMHSAPEEEEEGWNFDPGYEPPSYEFRFECAKLLLELDPSTEDAIEVLETLVAEDDMDPNVWHMLGLAYYSGGSLREATEAASRGEALLERMGVPREEDIWQQYADLRDAIEDARGKLGEDGEGGEGSGGAEDEEAMVDDDSDDED